MNRWRWMILVAGALVLVALLRNGLQEHTLRAEKSSAIAPSPATLTPDAKFASDKPAPDNLRETPAANAPAGGTDKVVFDNAGAEDVALAVERVAGAGRSKIALMPAGADDAGRRLMILSDGPARYYELDAGVTPDSAPWLKLQGFMPPPEPVSRHMSIFRSVAKPALNFRENRDRIFVLLCPKAEWPKIAPEWPK